MDRISASLVLIAWLASGCHVAERSRQCEHLSELLAQAAPKIAATKISQDPSPKILRKKARLYGQLSDQLKNAPVRGPEVKEENQAMITHLRNLEKHLKDAAKAVEEQRKFDKRQEKLRQKALRQSKERRSKKGQAPPKEDGAAPEDAPTDSPATAPPPQSALEKAARKLPPFIDTKKSPAKAKLKIPRSTVHSRRYARAKRSIEAMASSLASTQKRLEKACR